MSGPTFAEHVKGEGRDRTRARVELAIVAKIEIADSSLVRTEFDNPAYGLSLFSELSSVAARGTG